MDQTKQQIKLTFAAPFSMPAQGRYQNEPVRITHLGDAEGFSPVYHVVDGDGRSRWVPQNEVQITDLTLLPAAQETLDRLTSSTSSSQSRSSSSQPASAMGSSSR